MKTITILLTILFMNLMAPNLQAQQQLAFQEIKQLQGEKEKIVSEEKKVLKTKLEKINEQRQKNEIDEVEAKRLKKEAARLHAMNIENRINILKNQIALIRRNEMIDYDEKDKPEMDDMNWEDDRTDAQLVVAAGFNNALQEGQSLNNSDFKIAGSRFFEIGVSWRTRVFQESNWLRFKYGFSFQFNGLKPKNNMYFVEDGEVTALEVFPVELNKSKFRMDNLVFPVFFEIGPSSRTETDRGLWFSTENKFKMGFGGYAGFNIGERQKLKYEEDGDAVKKKNKADYNTNNVVYGVSAYIGVEDTSLYMKYDLNPIFQDPNVALNNISLGFRFDLD